MNLTLAQISIEPGARQRNLDAACDAIERAAEHGADLVVLPELFTVGYFAFDNYSRCAEPLDGETSRRIGATADAENVAVLAGSFVEDLGESAAAGLDTPAEDGLANTAVFLDSDGQRRAVYRKHHLFGYDSAEQDLLTPGETIQTVEFEGFTIGVTTCYDLRFPELYRRLVDAGVTLTLVPSAWPYPRVEHWKLFAQARAVENLMYVAATNGVGEFADATLLGRSALYDPWGTKLAGAGDDPTLVSARIDPARVTERREAFPALADRR